MFIQIINEYVNNKIGIIWLMEKKFVKKIAVLFIHLHTGNVFSSNFIWPF